MTVFPLAAALTIASSDSSGGAGIQADLKTFASLGVYGLTVICAVTAQNTLAVTAVESLSPNIVQAQLEAIWADIPPKAIKIGLIGSAESARVIFDFLKAQNVPLVVDPVLVSASGHVFLAPNEVEAVKNLFPLAALITPNIPEAAALTGISPQDPSFWAEAPQKLLSLGPQYVLIKGGHGQGPTAEDRLFGQDGTRLVFSGPRIVTNNTHGTGCTLSSAIAAHLAQRYDLPEAIQKAKDYVAKAFVGAPPFGRGPGPLNHFHQYYA
ncbi:MAG: bifunctional hydroxymethylpyrimidine kinase/phosphomethylpyrimidine kinase, partial [Deltaproteobacteria bacterium]|nr:bifunctional hydroxymethylpyrimidine kinase/phosphomethylpyrimidine kinase [Deltaproteobacteria bacterium]